MNYQQPPTFYCQSLSSCECKSFILETKFGFKIPRWKKFPIPSSVNPVSLYKRIQYEVWRDLGDEVPGERTQTIGVSWGNDYTSRPEFLTGPRTTNVFRTYLELSFRPTGVRRPILVHILPQLVRLNLRPKGTTPLLQRNIRTGSGRLQSVPVLDVPDKRYPGRN